MTTKFVAVIPGAVDDLGAEHNLSWSARSMLLWLAVTVDRETGILGSVSATKITDATGCSRRAVRRALDELEEVGGVEFYLPQGHEGHVTIVKAWHDQIVWKKGSGSRSSTSRSRSSSSRSRRSSIGSRSSSIGSRQSARANRDFDGERERRTESSSNSLSGGASHAAPPLEGAGGAGAAVSGLQREVERTAQALRDRDNSISPIPDGEDSELAIDFLMEIDKYCHWKDEMTGNPDHCWVIDMRRTSDDQTEVIWNRCRQVWGWLNGTGSPTPPHYLERIWNATMDWVRDNSRTCYFCSEPIAPTGDGYGGCEVYSDGDLRPVHEACVEPNRDRITNLSAAINTNGITQARAALTGQPVEDLL
jgi:hypothetical protein